MGIVKEAPVATGTKEMEGESSVAEAMEVDGMPEKAGPTSEDTEEDGQEAAAAVDEAIEKEKQEDEMAEKLRTGRIVECQVGSLKFRVQPPSPKVNVKRVKELQPLSELVAAAEKEEESTSPPIVTRSIDSDTFGDIVERASSVVDPQMSSSKPQNTNRPCQNLNVHAC